MLEYESIEPLNILKEIFIEIKIVFLNEALTESLK